MAVAEKQQQHFKADNPDSENVAYMDNQVLSKFTQKSLKNGVEKAGEGVPREFHTAENKKCAVTGEATQLNDGGKCKADKQLCSEGFAASVGRDLAAGDREEETDEKKVESVVVDEIAVSLGHDQLEEEIEEDAEAPGGSVKQVGATADEGMKQLAGCDDKKTVVDTSSSIESDGSAEVVSENDTRVDKVKGTGETGTTAASSVSQEVMETIIAAIQKLEEKEMIADNLSDGGVATAAENASVWAAVVEHSSLPLEGSKAGGESQQSCAEVEEAVGLVVTALVDDVVDSVVETVSLDAELAKVPSSPICMSHLSADEAMELLEVHQGDDHDLLPEHDEITDANMEVESTNRGYQWFDGDDEDDEGIAFEVPSVLDVAPETTDDVFGFGGAVDLTDVAQTFEENADMSSDVSADTRVVPDNSSSSSSSTSSSSSSSPSSYNSVSFLEDETAGFGSKKRRVSGNNGPRKLLKYKKQKCVRSSEPGNPSWRRPRRKRRIPKPIIPSEFAVFDVEAADPILKGSYSVRKNRRACFQGNWGFSDEAFHTIESVSPFEYTSHARVLQSRRKDDKRPLSGKYGGFFKLRQFNGTLVKIREDQVDLQFLPMPSSDEEDEGEDEDMEDYESDEGSDYEAAASRYIVLGKGKNRFGRFLIRGYLSPESGRLTVKRRYLE